MNEKLFLFTASGAEAYQHYIDTIEDGFDLDSVQQFLDEQDYKKLKALFGNEKVRAWGATPGQGNTATWQKMAVGDPILIYRNKNFEYYAIVAYKTHSPLLAKHLWGQNASGETWEYMYFLENLTEISVPVEVFNQLLGYQSHFFPQGFSAVQQERVESLVNVYGSVSAFLNYLVEGKWVEKEASIPEAVKKDIVEERVSRQIGKTNLLEANLENFLAERVEQIESGLKLLERQLDTREVGRLDLLCEDSNGALVVVELKRFKAGSSIIDQTQRYMGWVMEHRAKEGQEVRGIIVVGAKDTALEYAARANPNIIIKVFSINFT